LDLAGGLEFVEVLLFDARVVELDVGVVLDTGVVPCVVLPATCVVLAATFVPVVPVAPGIPVSDERSITPTPGATRLGIGSEAAGAVPEPLDPSSAPQAARPNVRRLHNTILRMCERTTKADLFIDHYPG
jgi:hypothetical protein